MRVLRSFIEMCAIALVLHMPLFAQNSDSLLCDDEECVLEILKSINSRDSVDFIKMALANYIDAYRNPELSPDSQMYSYILAADNILKKSTDYPTYVFVYQYFISGFSELGANMVVDYLIRMPYLEQINATSGEKNIIINISESYKRVKIGSKAPDIQTVTINKKVFNLDDVDSEYTIILFWSYSCPHCRDLIKELSSFAKNHKDFAVVTVNVSGDLKKVKRILRKNHLAQFNICDGKGWDSQIVNDYAVDMTPSLFLLDKDKIIIAKPFDIDDILNSIEL